ncbi:MAG: alpha/beta hydrolase [Deltaproteobacteria bacterium]|nr:alpha/beta hydrolase [Deltaproteobacteria bacterium]
MRSFATVTSKDGTDIAYERRGNGPPLVMVHGSAVDRTRWGGVVDALAERFTLFMMDRRGRGPSGDRPPYAIEREFEDVAAVLEATPAPARVLAHSYGALCSIEAARLTERIERLALYEPPLPLPGEPSRFAAALGQRLADILATGDRELVVETFLREVLRMSAAEIGRLRRTSSWPVHLATAATLPREVLAASAYRFRAKAFAAVRAPVLLLYGDKSPPYLQESTRMAAAALAGSQVKILRGHGHRAMITGPKVLLEKVLPFLGG